MRNWTTKIDNTSPLASGILTAAEDNARFSELENAVTTTGISLDGPSGPDADLNMLAQAMSRAASGGIMCTDAGAANAYVLAGAGSFIMPKAYFPGMIVRAAMANSCTGASTITAFGLGPKPVYTSISGGDPASGDIVANRLMDFVYFPSLNSGAGAFIIAPWSIRLANIGGGDVDVYKGRSGGQEQFRALKGINGAVVAYNGDVIEINGGGGVGGGEANYGSNLGAGTNVYKDKSGVVLRFRSLKGLNGISLAVNGSDEIEINGTGVPSTLKIPFNVYRFLSSTRAVLSCPPGEVNVESIAYTKWSGTSLLCVEFEISCVPTTTAVPGYKYVNIGGSNSIRQASHFSGPDGGSYNDAASESFRAHWAGLAAGAKTINIGLGRVTSPCTFVYNPNASDEAMLYPGALTSSYMIYEVEP